jgi:hypothetical protein
LLLYAHRLASARAERKQKFETTCKRPAWRTELPPGSVDVLRGSQRVGYRFQYLGGPNWL